MVQILEKTFVREFPLVLCQVWGNRYSNYFLNEKIGISVSYVFIFSKGIVTAYRNESPLSNALYRIIKNKLKKDKFFINTIEKQKENLLLRLEELEKKEAINHDELIEFINGIEDYWQVHYVSQFIPLAKKVFKKSVRDDALYLRERIDKRVHKLFLAIPRMIEIVFPKAKNYGAYITREELEKKTVYLNKIKMRTKKDIYLLNGKIVTKNKLDLSLKENNISVLKQNKVLKQSNASGKSTYSGVFEGKVRVINSRKDLEKVLSGEVLISNMFTPEMAIFCRKAGALVTEEGGITCHAAIISRELKIPCIVGVKDACKIFSNGKIVRVDSKKGIINLIKTKN